MKNKHLKITILITISIIMLATIIIYLKSDNYANVNIETDYIINSITNELGNDMPSMIKLDDEQVINEYKLDISKIADYIIKIPMMNIRADEIAIVKVKDINDVNYIKNKFRERVTIIESTFKGYLQEQYELTKNPLIISKGKYVLLSISDRNDDIQNIFNNCIVNNK